MKIHCNCKECVLHGKKIHNCDFCKFDLKNPSDVAKIMKDMRTTANTTIRENARNIELIFYSNDFSITGNTSDCNRSRKWRAIDEFSVEPKNLNDETATIKNLLHNIEKSRKRALDKFMDYGQNNTWLYFVTLTFAPKKVNREKQSDIKYCWKLFRQKMQYIFPDIQLLFVVEYHSDDKGLHFHGVIGNADLNNYIVRAINNQPYNKQTGKANKYYLQPILTDLSDSVYNLKPNFYNYGFSTIIPLKDKLGDFSVYDRIIFYLNKYMTKDNSVTQYNCKRYFATRNLKLGNKINCNNNDDEITELIENGIDITLKKHNDKMTVYVMKKQQEINLTVKKS